MHPPFFKIMDEIQAGLRYVFQTSSKYTLLISGTGHAGAMHACMKTCTKHLSREHAACAFSARFSSA